MCKLKYIIILIIILLTTCSNEIDPEWLPTFRGIDVNENTIFLLNTADPPEGDKIYAVDASNDRIIYRYEFGGRRVSDFIYDYNFDKNVYISFLSGTSYKLEIKSGKLIKFDLNYASNRFLSIMENKLWIPPNKIGFENSPVSYFTYNPKEDKIEYIELPEGIFVGKYTFINNKYYISLSFGSPYINNKIYNFTDKKIVGYNLFGKDYSIYWLKSNYLQGQIKDSNQGDFYYINSFDPLDGKFLFSYDHWFMIDVWEKDNFVFFVLCDGDKSLISKRDKNNNYSEVKSVIFKNSYNIHSYSLHNHIFLVSEDNDGVYKVNMDDLSYKVIK